MTSKLDAVEQRLEARFKDRKKQSTDFVKGKIRSPQKGWPPDKGLLPALRKIDRNPDVATVSSCSGMPGKETYAVPEGRGKFRIEKREHGGHPYVWLKFRNPVKASEYAMKMQLLGYQVHSIDGGLYFDIPHTDDTESISRRARPQEAKRFWNDAVKVFGR